MRKAFLAAILLAFIVAGTWIIAVPERFIVDLIEDSLSEASLHLRTEGFSKGLFYNFAIDRVSITRNAKPGEGVTERAASASPLLVLDDVSGRIDPLSVLKLNPELHLICGLQGGTMEGELALLTKGTIRMHGRNISIRGMPFLEIFGIRGDGELSGELRLRNGRGEAKLAVDNTRLENSTLGGFFLPLGLFHDIKGLITVQDKTIILQSLALQGNGVYARAKGEVTGRNLSVNLEVMADSSLQSGPALHTMLERYTVSPGYYLIPIRTQLPQ